MSHKPDQLAAAYLDGLRARARHRYEEHLLECELCWREVSLARRGRELAESSADTTPPGTRESIRAAVAAAATERENAAGGVRRRHLILATTVLIVLLALAGGIVTWRPWQNGTDNSTAPGSALVVAVASFHADRLPGTAVPVQHPPDLSTLGLQLVGASTGKLDSIGVTVFAYRDDTGTRLNLYRSTRPIPETNEVEHFGGPESAWQTEVSGVTVICGPDTHTELLISSDAQLVQHVGTLLNII
jgi:hypothetical protein